MEQTPLRIAHDAYRAAIKEWEREHRRGYRPVAALKRTLAEQIRHQVKVVGRTQVHVAAELGVQQARVSELLRWLKQQEER